jgi:hypothetical protein
MSLRSWPLLLAMAPAAALATPSAVARATTVTNGSVVRVLTGTSTNWSGYDSTLGGFTSVSASWTEPAVICGAGASYSSFWVGIDGDGSSTVEQTGSEADCAGGAGKYYSWYEMFPTAPHNFTSPVSPGDAFTASVTASGTTFTLQISDTTRGWTHTITRSRSSAKRHSAEIIAEAPTVCSISCRVAPLADFGTVSFTSATANGTPIGSLSPNEIVMTTPPGTVKAQPSALSSGQNFSITWVHH